MSACSGQTFDENLTTHGIDVNGALIAGHLEVSCPRIPCATFQGSLEREGWIKRFTQSAVPGAFLRVIEPGGIRVSHSVEIAHRPDHDETVALRDQDTGQRQRLWDYVAASTQTSTWTPEPDTVQNARSQRFAFDFEPAYRLPPCCSGCGL